VSERMVLAQKAYILFYIRKQPANGHPEPAAPGAQQRPSTAPLVQRTASLAWEDSLKPSDSSAGERELCSLWYIHDVIVQETKYLIMCETPKLSLPL